MIRAVIIDDEKPALDVLNHLLHKDGRVEVVGIFRKPLEALEQISVLQPDLVFLDMEMPQMSGVELSGLLLESLRELEVIFVTAHDIYAVEAFRLEALDYLLKPLTPALLDRAITRYQKQRRLSGERVTPLKETRIVSFGGFSVLGPGGHEDTVKWRTHKSKELMSFLFLKGTAPVPKGQIMQALWPDSSDEQAHSNLHTTLYKMKTALKAAGVLVEIYFKGGSYRMDIAGAAGDLWEFESFARENLPVTVHTLSRYIYHLELYQGDLFADEDYLWSVSKRAEMLGFYTMLSKKLCSYYIEDGRLAEAIQRITLLLLKSPLDEEAHELLMGIYFRQKDRISLIRHYHAMKELLSHELGLEPRESVRQIYNEMLYGR
ncbi:response regulator [Paenibacillus sp. MMS20-IR301]|uniref:response regulator n=1 Tax=Paenibacillus sp. MMS20-IR301 TaxID=2895946 RepID=UPI0028EBF9E8|nr:response regulator [Paenibacillus sp. MMS20-IR301]WNS46437.1 response regulator [Paenibacillus sp. MMS20-IR301]